MDTYDKWIALGCPKSYMTWVESQPAELQEPQDDGTSLGIRLGHLPRR